MSWLSRGIKSARKALHLPAITLGNVAKGAAALSTGGLGAGAIALGAQAIRSKLKSAGIGAIKQVIKSKAEKALHDRTATLLPPVVAPNTASPAVARPGGAPLRAAVARAAAGAAAPRRRRRRAAAGGRRAPTGGLDLRALSAAWKAAGKPGTWMDWIRSHR